MTTGRLWKSLGIILVICLLASAALVGCSQGSTPAPSAATKAPAPASSAAPAPATSAAPAPASSTAAAKPAGSVIELKITHTNPPVHFIHAIMTEWAKRIGEATGGKVHATVYSGDVLCPATDTYEALLNGVADIAFAPDGYAAARMPLTAAINMTGGFASSTAASQFRAEVYKNVPALADEHKLTHVMWLVCNSPANIHTIKPVKTLEDLKGKQLRSPPDITALTKSLGSVPVAMSLTDTFLAIQKGIVEGVIVSNGALKSFRFAEVTKYSTLCNIHNGCFYCDMNMDTWNKLPPDVQKAVTDLNAWGSAEANKAWDAEDQDALNWSKTQGHELIYPDKAEIARILAQVKTGAIDPWADSMEAKGKPAKTVVAEMQKILPNYRK
jgi:TRAP-type transport system periplasmic protein